MKRLQGFEQADLCYEAEVGGSIPAPGTKKESLMKKFIALLAGIMFCGGCYIPHPATGVRTPQVVETYERVCVVEKTKHKDGAHDIKTTRCRWVRTR